MGTLLVFGAGLATGVIYQKVILAWKNKALRAAQAAQTAFKQ